MGTEIWLSWLNLNFFCPDVSSVSLDDYNIHVIASVLKQWLRDLPSPLMTFELYEEFLRAMGKLSLKPVCSTWFADLLFGGRLLQLRAGFRLEMWSNAVDVCVSSSGQPDKREVIRGVYSVIDQLSRTHLSTLERLIFHLVRWVGRCFCLARSPKGNILR